MLFSYACLRTLSVLNVFPAFMKALDIKWTVPIKEYLHTSYAVCSIRITAAIC
jgi:hypothetical protein